MFCRKCGAKIPDDSEFCYKCGTSVKSEPKQKDSELWMYNECLKKMDTAKSMEDFNELEKCFDSLGDFKDSKELLKKCRENKIPLIYDYAVELMNSAQSPKDFEKSAENFKYTNGFKDSEKLIEKCEYNRNLWIYNDGYRKMSVAKNVDEFKTAKDLFSSVRDFEDSKEMEMECQNRINRLIYDDAIVQMNRAKTPEEYKAVEKIFQELSGFEYADEQAKKCAEKCAYATIDLIYNDAIEKVKYATTEQEFNGYAEIFRSLGDYKSSKEMAIHCENIVKRDELFHKYRRSITALECSNDISHLNETKQFFLSFGDFCNSSHLAKECERKIDCIKNHKPFVLVNNEEINKSELVLDISDFKNKHLRVDLTNPAHDTNENKLLCPNCGKWILSKNNRFCPWCSKELNFCCNENERVYINAMSQLESSNDAGALRKAKESFKSLDNFQDSEQIAVKCQEKINGLTIKKEKPVTNLAKDPEIQSEKSKYDVRRCSKCNHLIYSWNTKCPSCAQLVSGELESSAVDDNFEEKYHALKKGTLIALYVIMGIVVIVLFATGDLSDFSCVGFDRYKVWYTPTALIAVVGGALGLNIVRWIILLIYKATHKE